MTRGHEGGRNRKAGVKIEHHVIPGILPLLEQVASWPEVTSVIPGVIDHVSGGRPPALRCSVGTPTGLKLIARTGGAAQEVFVVTSMPDIVRARITGMMAGTIFRKNPDKPKRRLKNPLIAPEPGEGRDGRHEHTSVSEGYTGFGGLFDELKNWEPEEKKDA